MLFEWSRFTFLTGVLSKTRDSRGIYLPNYIEPVSHIAIDVRSHFRCRRAARSFADVVSRSVAPLLK